MKNRELIAILDRREMGRFFRDMKGHVSFVYDEKWRNAANAYPLSLSMPLTLGEHGNSKTDPFRPATPSASSRASVRIARAPCSSCGPTVSTPSWENSLRKSNG
jgi:HipA-like protein